MMTAIAEQPGLEQARLAQEVGVDRATLANVVARLESRGLLRRTTTKTDRRLKRVILTAKGKRLLDQMTTGGPARACAELVDVLSLTRACGIFAFSGTIG